jgi:hypothetical protein
MNACGAERRRCAGLDMVPNWDRKDSGQTDGAELRGAQYAKYRWLPMDAKKTVIEPRADVPTLALPDPHAGGRKPGCQSKCNW